MLCCDSKLYSWIVFAERKVCKDSEGENSLLISLKKVTMGLGGYIAVQGHAPLFRPHLVFCFMVILIVFQSVEKAENVELHARY